MDMVKLQIVLHDFTAAADYTGPTNRYQTASSSSARSIADGDGSETTSFIAEGCFAHEFRLIEAAEFVCFMGAPGTNGRNIQVFNSSGNLIDTVQLATSNTGSDFPTKVQVISNSTTDSGLTGSAKSYDLTAGMRFVSEVPVGAIVEDDSADNEENLFGLRTFAGFMTGAATVAVTGVQGSGQLGDEVTKPQGIFGVTGVQGTTALNSVNAAPQTIINVTNVAGTGATGSESVSGSAIFAVTGVAGTSALGNESTVGDNLVVITGTAGTSAIGTVIAVPSIEVVPTGVSATGSIGTVLAAGGAQVVEDAITGTVNLGDEAVKGDANLSVTGVVGTSGLDTDSTLVTFIVTVVSGNPSNHPYYNQGSTNKYAIGGSTASADVVLTLIEGRTYRFDQSDSSNSGHPIAIYEDADKTTQYTTGVTTNGTAGQAGAYTEITVPIGAPTLFYQCTNHALMGAQLNTDSATGTVVIGASNLSATGNAGTSALGTAIGVIPVIVSVTGSGATGSLGTATSSAVSNIVITGVVGTGTLGTLNLYGIIANEVSVSYTEVVPSQNANYEAA